MGKKNKANSQDSFQSYVNGHTGGNTLLGISFDDNPEQKELIRLMNEKAHPIIFCFGDAGTGKTFTSLTAALNLVKIQKKYSKIFYIREPIEVGKSLGFLPGDLKDKYGVYLDGMNDNLEVISKFSGIATNDLRASIECIPPQFIRGRSISDAIILVDEAQNLTLEEIHAICTRIGKYCKLIFLGSMKQIDIRGKSETDNDFLTAYEIIKSIEDQELVGYVELVKSERSEFCKLLDEAFNNYRKK